MRKLNKGVLLIWLLPLLLTQRLVAQSFDQERLGRYFDTLAAHNKFWGSVAVSKNGEILFTKSLGYARLEDNKVADENTKYRIGSISKTFTAVLVLQAVEKGMLTLEQTIQTYFPAVENADKITILHLLNHSSGIHNFTDDSVYLTYHTQPKSQKQLIDIISLGKSAFEPGSSSAYSNSNFVLLALILEKISHKPYAELVYDYIVRPLGLRNTYAGNKIRPENNEALSYKFAGNWILQPETDMSIPLGAGSMVSTPTDLVKFSNALFDGKLLKSESLQMMKTLQRNFGLGIFPVPFYDKKGYGHTGGIDGFNAVFCHFPDDHISYALTANGSNVVINDISIAVLSAAYNKPYEIPDYTAHQHSRNELEQYSGLYSSAQVPLKIRVTRKENGLTAQATGQSAFDLQATAKNTFQFDAAGIKMVFNVADKQMILYQGGGKFLFTKE